MAVASELAITHETDPPRGRYVARLGDVGEAHLTYKVVGPRLIVIDSTVTPPAARGRGVAGALMRQAMTDARAKRTQVLPACSYAAAWLDRHPEFADLRAEA